MESIDELLGKYIQKGSSSNQGTNRQSGDMTIDNLLGDYLTEEAGKRREEEEARRQEEEQKLREEEQRQQMRQTGINVAKGVTSLLWGTSEPDRGFYSRPDFEGMTAGAEETMHQREAQRNQSRQKMEMALGSAKGKDWEQVRTRIQEESRAADRDYEQSVRDLEKAKAEQAKEYQAWRKTIRPASAIEPEIRKLQKAIDQQRKLEQNRVAGDVMYSLGLTDGTGSGNPILRQQDSPELLQMRQKLELLQEERDWSKAYQYEDLTGRKDFREKSRYNPENSGVLYNIINGKEPPEDLLPGEIEAYQVRGVLPTADKQMEDRERQIYNYLYNTRGEAAAGEYLDYLTGSLNARLRQEQEGEAKAFGQTHPVIASVESTLTSPLTGIGYVGQAVDMARGKGIDTGAWYNRLGNLNNAQVAAVTEKIRNGKWGDFGAWGYGVGMSMAEFLTNLAVTGGNSNLTLAIMGSGAAADATVGAKDRGLSDDQAFTLGTIAGMAEIITEKVSLDALLDPDLLANGALKYIGKNILAEGSEEGASDLINLVADITISKDKSEWNQTIQEYEKQGYSEGEAFGKAVADQALSIGLDMLAGGISGGIMGAGGAGINTLQMQKTGQMMQKTGITDEKLKDMMAYGAVAGDETSQKVAEKLAEKVEAGQKLTAKDLGQLAMANTQAAAKQQAEQPKPFGAAVMEQLQARGRDQSVTDMNQQGEKVTTEDGITVSKDLADQAQRMSEAIGRNIRFFTEASDGNTLKNGYFQGGEIYINSESRNPMGQIIGHELTHSLQDTEAYNELTRIVQEKLGDGLEAKRQELRELYKSAGIELDESKGDLDHEIMAEYIEHHLLDSESDIRELVRAKPTVGQQIVKWCDKVLAKLGSKAAQERQYLRKVRSTYARALRESQRATARQETAAAQVNAGTEEKTAQAAQAAAQTENPQTDRRTERREPERKETFRERRKEYKRREAMSQEQRDAEDNRQMARENAGPLHDLARMEETYNEMLDNNQISQEEYDQIMDSIDSQRAALGGEKQYSVSKVDSEGRELSPEQQEFFRDSKVRDENGNLRVMYHGTNTGEFYKFEGDLTGSSNDPGWFGDGFYFAFTKFEAMMYGGRVIDAYLNLKNPFLFLESFYGEGENKNTHTAVYFENLQKMFPELAEKATAEVLRNGDDTWETIPAVDLAREVREIAESPDLTFGQVDDDYNATGKANAYLYKGQEVIKTYEDKESAEGRYGAAEEILTSEFWDEEAENYIPAKYEAIEFQKTKEFTMDHAKEFTQALKDQGYDGVLQSMEGDEAVAFYPEQIKSVSNKTPTSDPDIRYSVSRAEPSRRELVGWIDSAYYAGAITEEEHDRYQAKLEQTGDDKLKYYKLPQTVEEYRQEENRKAEQAIREQNLAREEEQRRENMTPEQKEREQQETLHITRDQLNTKQQRYLKRAENDLLRKLKQEMGIDKFPDRQEMKDAITEIADAYLEGGVVPEEKIDQAFQKVFTEGIVYDRQFFDEHQDAREYMRSTPITLSARDQADIADYGDFRKRTRHLLRIVNEGGFPVDKAYQDLQEIDPSLFPKDITHPADQLARMYDVADMIRITEGHLADYDGEDRQFFEMAMRESFNRAMDGAMSKFRDVRRVAQEADRKEKKQEALIPNSPEEVMDVYKKMKDARRAKDRVVQRNLLTHADDVKVGKLLRGELGLEDLDPEHDNVKGITAVYEAKREYEEYARVIRAYKAKIHKGMMDIADGYLKTAIKWKDKKSGLQYARETMRRNILDIVPDKELANEILREYFEPVQIMEAKSIKFQTDYRNRVRKMNLSRDVAAGNVVSEAHAVQLYGEAVDNINYLLKHKGFLNSRGGKSLRDWEGIVENLWAENPNLDQKKITNAVEEFRKIYDELFQQMNLVRIQNGYEPVNYTKGYFPHFQPGEEDGVMAAFGRALGINTAVDNLPTSINGLTHTFRPGITFFGNAQERLGVNTAYDAVEGFDRYIVGVANVIHHTRNIQMLRALASRIRYWTTDDGIREQVDTVNADPDLAEDLKKLKIEDIYKNGKFVLSNFVNELEEYTNLLAGKKSKLDRSIESLFGRRAYTIMKNWENRVGANMIAGNISSAMTNFIPLAQAWSRTKSKYLLQGMWDTLANLKEPDGLMETSDFYTSRKGSDPLVQTWAQKVSGALGTPMELIDSFVTESIVRGARYENLEAGLSEAEAMHQADLFASGVMADRSRGSMPTLFESRNPMIKAFTQFQLEVNNQWSEMAKDLPRYVKDRGMKVLALVLLKYFLGTWLYNQFFEKLFGRKPGIDPLSMVNDRVGDLSGYKLPNLLDIATGNGEYKVERVHVGKAIGNAVEDVVGELPFSSALAALGFDVDGGRIPVASSVPNLRNIGNAIFDPEMSGKKRWDITKKEAGKLMYVVPPFGGGQVLKSWKGIAAYLKGGSYSVNKEGKEELQYPIYKDNFAEGFGNLVISSIMGKNATGEARKWVDRGFKSMSANDTDMYKDILATGASQHDAYDFIQGLSGIQKTEEQSQAAAQRAFIRDADMTGEAKAIAYYGTLASDEERELMDSMADMGADDGTVTDVLMQIHDADSLSAGKTNAKREAILHSALTEEEKMELYRQKLLQDPTSKDADIDAFAQAGLDFDQFLTCQNEYSRISQKDMKAGQKAVEFSRWVEKQAYSSTQKDLIRTTFAYYNMMPANAEKYEKYIAMGIKEEKAYELAETIGNLGGAGEIEKYQAILNAGLTEQEQMAAFQGTMKAPEYSKLETASRYGVTPKQYVEFRQAIKQFDEDKNEYLSRNEIEKAINAIGTGEVLGSLMGVGTVSKTGKAALWQLANRSWKPNKNPFSREVGQQVYDELNREQP